MTGSPPRVMADGPLDSVVDELLDGQVELLPWGDDVVAAEGIYTYGHLTVDAAMLDRISGVKVVSNYGVGVDHIDVAAARERGIPVGNTPGVLNGATADMAMALLLAASRRLVEGDRYARGLDFTTYDPGYMLGREVHGTTLGIVGLGRIGEEIAKRASAFGMRVRYHNRNRKPDAERELGVEYAGFSELLAECDHIVLSVPLTTETRGLMGATELAAMKSTAVLINVARGPVIDTDALTTALRDKQIYAAGLDVTDPEPLPRDHPLLRLDNVVIAPHLGSATEQTRRKMAEMSVANLLAGLRGDALPHSVAFEEGVGKPTR